MRIVVTIDSASDAEAKAFIYAFQRSKRALMQDDVADCTVRMAGAFGVTTPPISQHHASALMEDFTQWSNEQGAARLLAIVDPKDKS